MRCFQVMLDVQLDCVACELHSRLPGGFIRVAVDGVDEEGIV